MECGKAVLEINTLIKRSVCVIYNYGNPVNYGKKFNKMVIHVELRRRKWGFLSMHKEADQSSKEISAIFFLLHIKALDKIYILHETWDTFKNEVEC